MGSLDLVYVCAPAIAAVFLLLTVLAMMMRIILVQLPTKDTVSGATVIAAIATVAPSVYPAQRSAWLRS